MKTKTMRNVLLWITGVLLFVFLAGICVVQSMQKRSARAAEVEVWKTGVFEMNDGVSLRFSDENGLRFIVKMDEDIANFVTTTEEAEMGFIIAPESLMLAANGDYMNMAKKIGGAIDKNKIYQEGDYYQANACITAIKYNNLELDFVAVAYIQYNGEIRYTEYNDKAKLNMYDLVNMAFLNGYSEAIQEFSYLKVSDEIGWYGSNEFPIVVENTDEYEEVVALANDDNINLENNVVVVKNNVTTNDSFTAERPIIISSELDEVNKLIAALPDSITMPDAIGQIGRIRDAEKKYNALSDENKAQVEDYAKVEILLQAIEGYDRVYKNDATDGTVIPSYVPGGYSSTIGGTATTRTDDVYGNVLTVRSDASGKAALSFKNFPSAAKYSYIYFYVKVDVGCNLYLSDGTSNDGWGDNGKNNWSMDGYWCNANTWKLVEVPACNGYFGTNFALGFRTDTTGFTFEISDFYGLVKEKRTSFVLGKISDVGETNENGKTYNFAQDINYDSDSDIDSFSMNELSAGLPTNHDSYYFWIYNPNTVDVTMEFIETANSWRHLDVTTLAAQAWTKVVISPETIEVNNSAGMVCVVSQGAKTSGWKISSMYSMQALSEATKQEAELNFGTRTDTGTTNEYGKVYNISREQWYIDKNNTNTIGTLQASKLANALPAGFEYFYFWMYNGTGTEYNFHLAGDVSGTWTDSADSTPLKVGEWTKVTISAADIELNKGGQWYVYILGGDGAGAAKDGWKISTIYAGPDVEVKDEVVEIIYLDHADVKDVIALINALPATATLADKATVEAARAAYNLLTLEQQSKVGNLSKLQLAENAIADIEAANEVVAMIDAINSRDIDADLVEAARAAYATLSDVAKGYVTNFAVLEEYEAQLKAENDSQEAINNVNTKIANLPDSVVMPDHLVFVTRIEAARDAYNALTDEQKGLVADYAKLRTLVNAIKGYETVHVQTLDGVNVIPSHVPNYTSTIGGTATMGYDGYYGDYLKVTPDAGGKVAIQFKDFADVSAYTKLYFNIRVVGASCDLYLSDGITNDGWGDNWHNTWSMSGFWANNGNWIQKEVDPSTGIFTSNWALGLRTNTTGVSFEITNVIGYAPLRGTNSGLTFGNFTDSGTLNAYGTVYNFTQGWSSDTDLGAFNQNALKNALASGHDSLHFWIYNPNESAVDFKFAGDMNEWNPTGEYVTNLPSKVWTEVVITPEIIEQGNSGTWFVNVTTGAGTSGWQISPIYSFSSQSVSEDAISAVQARIDALDVGSPDAEKVAAARTAYEALSEAEKALLEIDILLACETSLYGDCANQAFVTDEATEYKIYYEAGLKTAATFMQEQLALATGATLPLESAKPNTITKYRYAVVLGYEDLAQQLGFTDIPTEEVIGTAGYVIKKMGRTVFIVARGADGYRMGMLAFLRDVIGYEMISEDCVVYSKDGTTLPEFNLSERPAFDYRQQQTYMTKDEVYGMGLQAHTDLWVRDATGWDMHNALNYLPTANYASSHPNWYTSNQKQICPTAGGTSSEFNAMVDVIVANMMVQINAQPAQENISFSIMDSAGNDACTCARCTLYNTLYGEAGFSAAWIDLMNAINEKIQDQIGDRKLNVAFLAYRSTEAAPANNDFSLKKRYQINDDGSYTQTSEDLKCDDGVMVWLAPINGKYAENFNHADNAATLATIKKWCALSNNVYLWMYGTNFKFYMYPYNTWKASAENYKILADLGVKGAWSQSNETEATAFSDLKAYIDSKFMVNVNADYDTVLNTYFNNYFGAGATKMRTMFDKIVAKCEEIEEKHDGLGRGIYDELENTSGGFLGIGAKTYWEKDWMESLVTLCDEAKAAVDADSSLTDAQKTAIKNRITKESLFPRYVLCTTFAGKYSSNDKKTMRQAFKADATALGLTLYKEANGLLSDLYDDWGV